ncbi:receptor-like protein EIX1 [Juglans microcarpa x Juglans regia]|uniref:receptor-like protein EIX1 n=1 Tax=Juglans microcarpa x Juglans regia TaxID=2249226 RepID=UPI001B7F5C9A|nr:receptor-like protein EIX1 [Juglans microcarpa x Juglans regia]
MASSHNFVSIAHLFMFFFFLFLLGPPCLEFIKHASCTESLTIKCFEKERNALLAFKESLTDPSGRLSSWVGENCCTWIGVGCDNRTRHVVKLDLKNPVDPVFDTKTNEVSKAFKKSCLGGKISTSLLDLKLLSYLDLSLNNFNGSNIPTFLGSLESLRYLNLSFSTFGGVITPHLGNLSRLQCLDLNSRSFFGTFSGLEVESLHWLAGFPSLKYLSMSVVNLYKASDWLQAVNDLPSLSELHLRGCGLVSLPQTIYSLNFTGLSVLDLSSNKLDSPIPHWLSNLSDLTVLNLASSSLRGVFSDAVIFNLHSLRELHLSDNIQLEGQLPSSLGNLTNLRILDLYGNYFIGEIPSSFANLCQLQTFDLRSNNVSGEIVGLVDGLSQCSTSNLESLFLSDNKLLGGILPHSLGGLEKLKTIDLASCSFWGSIPSSVGKLSSLQQLLLSENQMNGSISETIGNLSMLVSLNLDSNFWEGALTKAHFQNLSRLERMILSVSESTKWTLVIKVNHDWLPPFKLKLLGLDNVLIGPQFPAWLQNQTELVTLFLHNVGIFDTIPHGFWNSCSNIMGLYIANNGLRGQIPENIGELLPKLSLLDFSSNSLTGGIPFSIGMLKELEVLFLRNNYLSGELPPHWKNLSSLSVLDISNNSISGNFPSSMQYLSSLELLSLSQNHLEGELPSFFRYYTGLRSLDLGGNKFFGNLSAWIGESLSSLLRLRLRSNSFEGSIPSQLCLLSGLRILDLADNYLSGGIPPCLGNLSTKTSNGEDDDEDDEEMFVVMKGKEYLYDSILYLVHSFDLSNNNLSGEIPDNITSLSKFINLNLSVNHLNGRIPENIGNMQDLESLDLSRNELSGPIPENLSALYFLSHLNLSFNNLSGQVPYGKQLQTIYDPSIYEGNYLLCGPPLPNKCPGSETEPRGSPGEGNGEDDRDGKGVLDSPISFYISLAIGFIVGFWVVCGTLIVKTSWRLAYFRSFDHMKDKIYIFIMLKLVPFLRRINLERR